MCHSTHGMPLGIQNAEISPEENLVKAFEGKMKEIARSRARAQKEMKKYEKGQAIHEKMEAQAKERHEKPLRAEIRQLVKHLKEIVKKSKYISVELGQYAYAFTKGYHHGTYWALRIRDKNETMIFKWYSRRHLVFDANLYTAHRAAILQAMQDFWTVEEQRAEVKLAAGVKPPKTEKHLDPDVSLQTRINQMRSVWQFLLLRQPGREIKALAAQMKQPEYLYWKGLFLEAKSCGIQSEELFPILKIAQPAFDEQLTMKQVKRMFSCPPLLPYTDETLEKLFPQIHGIGA